ncbi:MAG: PEGA domain-containing protein [Lachnospiraceae bacterium]|jgi:hypothetical protein|nr:PEGA domain-containing protein [Lachnospiraceae bacterium]
MKARKCERSQKERQIRQQMHFCLVAILLWTILLTGCAEQNQSTQSSQQVNDIVLPGVSAYDSADTAVLIGIGEDHKTLTLRNLIRNLNYTLNVQGTSEMYNQYEEPITLAQLRIGEIVEVTFLREKKKLTTLRVSNQAWRYESISSYEWKEDRQELKIGEETYRYGKELLLFSKDKLIERTEVNPTDVLSIRGIDKDVLSVRVESGHGYLRLENEEQFIGGYIEIGQVLISEITEDMRLSVPEGNYQVLLSNKGNSGQKVVKIERNEETILDLQDLSVVEIKKGSITFTLTPESAKLYVDGQLTDWAAPISMEYGLHQIYVSADGYESITKYLRVAEQSNTVTIALDSQDDTSGSTTESDASTTQTSEETQETTQTDPTVYDVYVEAPEGVEVYLDGNYIGIAPCSFRKVPGTHTIVLWKYGYENRSYTVLIDEEQNDSYLSFADLIVTSASDVSAGNP